jgi:hypothetical protein
MRAKPALLPEGWYQPPPGGVSVLIGRPTSFARVGYTSLRDPQIWPRGDIELADDSLVYAYASPTDRASGLIGDFGVTLYSGSRQSVRDHVERCLQISVGIAEHAEVGMELRELFRHAERLIAEAELSNRTASATDGGAANIGHTVPWSFEPYSASDRECIDSGDVKEIAALIRGKRIFLNATASQRIAQTMAFSVEPRMASAKLPLTSFHLVVAFIDGRKRVFSNFDALFARFGMDRYLPVSALGRLRAHA